MRLATWNINSVRFRITLVRRFLREFAPDVLCLQETKVEDDLFPRRAFESLGYAHHAIRGQKGYHGVAILSKIPLTNITSRDWAETGDTRHISAELDGGIELHNFYVPAGGDVPDPKTNPKFDQKLRFMGEMADAFADQDPRPRILVGDINIAPLETDVWSHKNLLKIVSHTPVEVELFERTQAAGNWVDAVRHFIPPDQQLYSWWSYRSPNWEKADKGRRLDHVWVSPDLAPSLRSAAVITKPRGWKKASDHAPIIIDLKVGDIEAGDINPGTQAGT